MNALILSNALDTNGQNARYAKASEKWGTDEGVLKALAVGHYDPAGVVGRFQIASEKFSDLKIRSVHRAQHIYQQMPADIVWKRANDREIRELAAEADIIHLNNDTIALRRLQIRGKPFLLHHHGSLFRWHATKRLLAEARHFGMVQCVSTVDLMRVAPDLLHWAPTAYDIDWLQAFGNEYRREPDDRIRVVQCPTDGKDSPYKSTNPLRAAVAKLQAEGLPVDLEVVTDKPWAEAMKRKATADIYFDQVKLGYGCNAVEAWGMGIPVIAGADPWTLQRMRKEYANNALPFYEATEDSIAEAIVALASSKAKRTQCAKRGMAHVRKFHDERPALTRLAELYAMAISQPLVDREPTSMPTVTFRASVPQVRVAGRFITFTNGEVQTDNRYIAQGLRMLAMKRPGYGIEEVA